MSGISVVEISTNDVEEVDSEAIHFAMFKRLGASIDFGKEGEQASLPGNASLLAVSNIYGAVVFADARGMFLFLFSRGLSFGARIAQRIAIGATSILLLSFWIHSLYRFAVLLMNFDWWQPKSHLHLIVIALLETRFILERPPNECRGPE
jgi:hypothetical protein